MSDPPDFKDDDIEMGEPVTDKLNVLLDELYDEWGAGDEEVDLGEPVTDKLNNLLSALPADWESEDSGVDLSGPVTDRLTQIIDSGLDPGLDKGLWSRARRSAARRRLLSDVSAMSPRGMAIWMTELAKALFGRKS